MRAAELALLAPNALDIYIWTCVARSVASQYYNVIALALMLLIRRPSWSGRLRLNAFHTIYTYIWSCQASECEASSSWRHTQTCSAFTNLSTCLHHIYNNMNGWIWGMGQYKLRKCIVTKRFISSASRWWLFCANRRRSVFATCGYLYIVCMCAIWSAGFAPPMMMMRWEARCLCCVQHSKCRVDWPASYLVYNDKITTMLGGWLCV